MTQPDPHSLLADELGVKTDKLTEALHKLELMLVTSQGHDDAARNFEKRVRAVHGDR